MSELFAPRNGVLHCEDVPLPQIAERAGTPSFVYSAAAIRANVSALRQALAPLEDPLIAYAVKANPNRAVIATVTADGLGADVVSGGEYQRARAAGVAPGKIVFSGVGKTAEEMAVALDGGLLQFNLESVEEAEMLSQVAASRGMTAPAALRINPDIDAGSHKKISTGSAQNKFGIPLGQALATFRRLVDLPGLAVKGVAVHIGSQLTDLSPLEAAFIKLGELIRDLRGAGHRLATADLGGGLGIAYDKAAPPPPLVADYGRLVTEMTRDWGLRLIFEPGRLLVGNAGVLLTRVIRVKPGPSHPFVIVDAAMNDLLRPSLYDAWHGLEAVEPCGESMTADVVGPICETGDSFAQGRQLDRVQPGDLMILRTAGAYAAAMGSTYNSRPLAAEVLVDGGRWALVRERQSMAEMVAGERLPEWLEERVEQ